MRLYLITKVDTTGRSTDSKGDETKKSFVIEHHGNDIKIWFRRSNLFRIVLVKKVEENIERLIVSRAVGVKN